MVFSRRQALKTVLASGVGLVTGSATYGAVYERHHMSRTDLDIGVSGLPPALEGLRIGLITDVHHSSIVSGDDVTGAVEVLRRAAPDMIVLGGDYISFGDRRFVGPVAERLAPLVNAPMGAFAILGNHDDDRDMPAALSARGFTVLRDQRTTTTIRGERVDLVGIRFWTRKASEIASLLSGSGETTLLLAHDPRRLDEAAALDVQLVLSGHTHGGQVLLPGVGAIAGRRFPVLSGAGRRDNTALFVSRGVGTVYVPVRFNCPPEVAVLTLRRKSEF